MSALTVFVAPSGLLAGVREALADWSALGLVNGFLWIEPAMITSTGIKAVQVEAGRKSATTLEELAGIGGYDRLRLCVLVPGIAGQEQVSSAAAQRVAEVLEGSFGRVPVVR